DCLLLRDSLRRVPPSDHTFASLITAGRRHIAAVALASPVHRVVQPVTAPAVLVLQSFSALDAERRSPRWSPSAAAASPYAADRPSQLGPPSLSRPIIRRLSPSQSPPIHISTGYLTDHNNPSIWQAATTHRQPSLPLRHHPRRFDLVGCDLR